jgi:hypothetical protein
MRRPAARLAVLEQAETVADQETELTILLLDADSPLAARLLHDGTADVLPLRCNSTRNATVVLISSAAGSLETLA